jgi:hypothetical protein
MLLSDLREKVKGLEKLKAPLYGAASGAGFHH